MSIGLVQPERQTFQRRWAGRRHHSLDRDGVMVEIIAIAWAQGEIRLTLKAINDELRNREHNVRLERAGGYFYFHLGEAADWGLPRVERLDRRVAFDGSRRVS